MCGSRYEELEKIMKVMNSLQKVLDTLKSDIDYTQKNNSTKLIDDIQIMINKNIENVKELKDPFLLFIMGCGNYGKSTLINVLLNKKIVKTNDMPNTWKLDLFIKSSKELMEITYKDKTKKRLNLKQGNKFLQIEEEKIRKSRSSISRNLSNYKKNNKVSTKELKKYKSDLEKKELYNSNIEQIKYFINSGNILNDFIIVDTPGLNQTLLKNTIDRMKEYYIKADGVIWLIDAQNIVSNENSKLIEEINKIDDIHDVSKNIIAVVNKMDIISKHDEGNIEKVKRKVNEIFKDKFHDIVYISAKQASDGIFNYDYELIEESNIDNLYYSIEKNFTQVCEKNQIQSKYKNLYIMKDEIIYKIYEYKRELYKEISRYNEVEFELKEKSSEIKLYVSKHINNLKNKSYDESSQDYMLKQDIENLQNQCSLDLKKIYEVIYEKVRLDEIDEPNIINTNVYFSRSKNLISKKHTLNNINYKPINKVENVLNNITLKIHPKSNTKEITIKDNIYTKINNLKQEVTEIVDNKIKLIESNIYELRNKRFKETYLDYSNIKKHIKYLNDIEKILSNLR